MRWLEVNGIIRFLMCYLLEGNKVKMNRDRKLKTIVGKTKVPKNKINSDGKWQTHECLFQKVY